MALVVITGAARSGKSQQAQALASELRRRGRDIAVAVFGRAEGDEEFAERIRLHKESRPHGFATLEIRDPLGWSPDDREGEALIVECVGTLLSAIMSDLWDRGGGAAGAVEYEHDVETACGRVIDALCSRSGDTLVVTNEVGWGVVPEYPSGRVFRDVLGRVNRTLVARADAAYLCVSGRMLDISMLPKEASWPED